MSEKEREPMTLYVPTNIRTQIEIVSGYGFPELAVTAIATVVAIVIAFVIYGIFQELYNAVLFVLVVIAATFMAVRKNDINQSMTDMLLLFFRFMKTQRKYRYEYMNPFMGKDNA